MSLPADHNHFNYIGSRSGMLLSQGVQTAEGDFIVCLPARCNRRRPIVSSFIESVIGLVAPEKAASNDVTEETIDDSFDGRPKEKPRPRCRRGLAWASVSPNRRRVRTSTTSCTRSGAGRARKRISLPTLGPVTPPSAPPVKPPPRA